MTHRNSSQRSHSRDWERGLPPGPGPGRCFLPSPLSCSPRRHGLGHPVYWGFPCGWTAADGRRPHVLPGGLPDSAEVSVGPLPFLRSCRLKGRGAGCSPVKRGAGRGCPRPPPRPLFTDYTQKRRRHGQPSKQLRSVKTVFSIVKYTCREMYPRNHCNCAPWPCCVYSCCGVSVTVVFRTFSPRKPKLCPH